MKTAIHYNPITSYPRGKEVLFAGEEFICQPPAHLFSVMGVSPYDTRFWKRKNKKQISELDQRINEAHEIYCKIKRDDQLLETLAQKEQTDENYYAVNQEEILKRHLN